MSQVEFEEINFKPKKNLSSQGGFSIISLLIKAGIVKNEKQANYLLCTLSIIFLILTFYIYSHFVFTKNLNNTHPETISPVLFPPGSFPFPNQK